MPGTTTSSVGSGSSALGLAALADRAEQTRLTGGDLAAGPGTGRGACFERTDRNGPARSTTGRAAGSGGPGWMARARAEYHRLIGEDDPALWRAAIDEFG